MRLPRQAEATTWHKLHLAVDPDALEKYHRLNFRFYVKIPNTI